MPTLLKHENYKRMPWKNGLGTTAEIAISPIDADFSAGSFDYRISSATVSKASAFSQFPGFDRVLCVWQGTALVINGTRHESLVPFYFSGDEKIQCEPDGPVVDIGVIYRRDKFKVHMTLNVLPTRLKLENGVHYFFFISSGDTLKVEGPAMINPDNPGASYLHIHIQPVS